MLFIKNSTNDSYVIRLKLSHREGSNAAEGTVELLEFVGAGGEITTQLLEASRL